MMKRSLFTIYTIFSTLFLLVCRGYASFTTSVLVSQIARLYSMRITTAGDRIILSNRYNRLEFEKNSRRMWINNYMLYLHEPCRRINKSWSVRNLDFKLSIDPILRAYKNPSKKIPKRIVLDPGHGGKDIGAKSKLGITEDQVVLPITLLTKKILEKYGFKVYLTRTNLKKNAQVTLQDRINFTKKMKADLFISIHANSATSSSANGIETYVTTIESFNSTNSYSKNQDTSVQINNKYNFSNAILGYALQSNLLSTCKRKDRGLRRARFKVIKSAVCPSALIECAFLSHSEEEALLRTKEYHQKVAIGIANGIRAYTNYNYS